MKFIIKYPFWIIFMLSSLFYAQSIDKEECNKIIEEGIKLMFEKKHVQSLELLVKASTIAEESNWHSLEFRAILNTGSNYYLMSDFGEALNYYLKAYELAIAHLDTKDELTVLNNIGILYFQENDLPKAKDYFEKAYQLSFDQKDKSKHGYYAINLALVSNKLGLSDEAERFIREALPLVKDKPDIVLMANLAMAENLFTKKKYREATELSKELLPQMVGEANTDNKVFILLLLAQIAAKENNPAQELAYAIQARKTSTRLENREDIYNAISRANANLGNYDAALVYKDSVLVARENLQNIRNNALYENNKIKFELQNYAHELSESRKLIQRERRFFYTLSFTVGLLLILMIWIFLNYMARHKQRKKISELELEQEKNRRLLAERQIQEQQTRDLLEQERLKNELDKKNRALTSKALYLSSRNDLIQEIVDELAVNPQLKAQPELLAHIRDLSKHLKKDPQIDSFFSHFEEVNPGFSNRLLLINPKLTQQDVRFIIYIYMNLGNNEIAALLNISPQSCRKRKERISKKLDLPHNVSLNAYIASI
jgi:Flp pilus assembly protein TadD